MCTIYTSQQKKRSSKPTAHRKQMLTGEKFSVRRINICKHDLAYPSNVQISVLQKLEKRKLEAAATERFEYARRIKGAIGTYLKGL